MMQWTVRATFGATAAFLLLIGALTYRSNRTLVERGLRAHDSYTLLSHIDHLLFAIDKLEDIEPGYVNSAGSTTRSLFQSSEIAIHSELEALRTRPHLDPAKKRKFDSIHDRLTAAIDKALEAREARGEGSVGPGARAGRDQATSEIEQIVGEIRTIAQTERLELETLTEMVRTSAQRALASLLIAITMTIMLLMISVIVIRREMGARAQAGARLESANAELGSRLDELQRRTTEIELLTDLGEILQLCSDLGETPAIISSYLPRLFPGTSGAIYVTRPSNNASELLAGWGFETPPVKSLDKNECWAIRRGRMHRSGTDCPNMPCRHVSTPEVSSICIPMQAEAESFGILHIAASSRGILDGDADRLCKTVSEHLSLALANIRLRDSLRTRAIRDPLTGLFNRRYMEESLEREILRADRRGSVLAVSMIDVDHFKKFNDTFGHAAGDAVLQQLGALMQASFRGEDIMCRYGGEEFIVILTDTTGENAVARLERLRESVKRLVVRLHGETLGTISISAGVALYPAHGLSTDSLVGTADSFLYRAKAEGRDRVVHGEDLTACMPPPRPLRVIDIT